MSYREYIQVFHPVDVQKYLDVLENEFGARPHPEEPGAFLVGLPTLPFYQPQFIEDHLSILGFNRVPLSSDLARALLVHPELAPRSAMVWWTAEQDLLARGTLESVGRKLWESQGKEWKR